MLQTLPQSLRQKLQPRVVAGMPGDALRRQAQAQVSGGNPAGAIATLREGVARYPDDPCCASTWPGCCKNRVTAARPLR